MKLSCCLVSRENIRQKGFTLVEIMLVIFILSLVVSMITITMSGTFEIVDSTEKQGEIHNQARVAMQRISEDLSMAVIQDGMPFTGEKKDINGRRADLLQFASMGHLVFDEEHGKSGMARILYQVKQSSENEKAFVLLRSDVLLTPQEKLEVSEDSEDGQVAFVLCDWLQSVEFEYYNHDGEQLEQWGDDEGDDSEEGAAELPVMVSVTLVFWQNDVDTITFETSVVIPVGLVRPAKSGEQNDAT